MTRRRHEPPAIPPPRIRVERALGYDAIKGITHAPGWIVLYGLGGSDWCPHPTHAAALRCANDRAAARTLGAPGRW